MRRAKLIITKLLFPELSAIVACIIMAIFLIIYTLILGNRDTYLAYPTFIFSIYTIMICGTWIWKQILGVREKSDIEVGAKPLIKHYIKDTGLQIHVSLYFSLLINVAYATMKMISGFIYHSAWIGAFAIYYILLSVMRFLLLKESEFGVFGENIVDEWKKCRLCGILLLIMNLALTGVVMLVVFDNEGFTYDGYLIYIMAGYTLFSIIVAVRNVVKFHKFSSPVLSTAKALDLVVAMVAILSLETAMIAQLSNHENKETFRKAMTGVTGAVVCIIVLGMGVLMIIRSNRELKAIEKLY